MCHQLYKQKRKYQGFKREEWVFLFKPSHFHLQAKQKVFLVYAWVLKLIRSLPYQHILLIAITSQRKVTQGLTADESLSFQYTRH